MRYLVRESKLHHISFLGLCVSCLLVYHFASLLNFLFTQQLHISAASVHTIPITAAKNDIATSKPSMCSVLSNTTALRKLLRSPVTSSNHRPYMFYMCMHLLSCGDIETHPGPSCYPCAYCQLNADWRSSGKCCDICKVWLRHSCTDLSLIGYNKLYNISASWRCYRCNCSNHPGSRYHSDDFEVSNPYDVLSYLPYNSTDQDIALRWT